MTEGRAAWLELLTADFGGWLFVAGHLILVYSVPPGAIDTRETVRVKQQHFNLQVGNPLHQVKNASPKSVARLQGNQRGDNSILSLSYFAESNP